MTDKTSISPPTADDTQEVRGNLQGTKGPHFGNEYDSHTHNSPARVAVGQEKGGVGIGAVAPNHAPGEGIPPEAGTRGWIDQKTGAVHGSGSGAGSGQPGEDFDSAGGGGGDGAAGAR